jgi:hypothetical protein
MMVSAMKLSDRLGRLRRWPVMVVGVAVLAIAVSLAFPAGRHQWAVSIFRQPARYTALAFNYAWQMPTTATIGGRVDVFFTVTNEQGRAESYRYVLRQIAPGESQQLGHGVGTVAAGATWTVDTHIRPTCSVLPCEVQVALPGYPETIDFQFKTPLRHPKVIRKAARGKHRKHSAHRHKPKRT